MATESIFFSKLTFNTNETFKNKTLGKSLQLPFANDEKFWC